jgi:hypothetical protein
MWIPFSISVVLSMMVACHLASIALGAFISIFITLNYTSIDVYIFVNGCIPTLFTSSFVTSFYFICASTNRYSTPLFSSTFSMYIGSIDITPSPTCSLEFQPLLRLHKNSIIDVPNLYNLELSYAQIASSHCTLYFLHVLKIMVNVVATSLPTTMLLSTLLLFFFFNNFVSSSYLCLCSRFLFLYYSLQFFNHTFCTHVSVNSIILKTHTTSNNKQNQFLIVIPIFWSLSFLPIPFNFYHACHFN